MSDNRDRWLANDALSRWRRLGLLDGWSPNNHKISVADEILFNAPITYGWGSPQYRLDAVACTLLVAGNMSGKKGSKKIISVDQGWLCGTDRRFCLLSEKDHSRVDIPYCYLSGLECRDRDFYFRVDYERLIKDKVACQILPACPPGMSDQEYETRFIIPLFLQATEGAPTELIIRTKFPQAGLMDALLIMAANNFVERYYHTQYAVSKNENGTDFLWAFYSCLHDI